MNKYGRPAGTARAPPVSQRVQHSMKSPCFMYTKINTGINGSKFRFQTSSFSEDFEISVKISIKLYEISGSVGPLDNIPWAALVTAGGGHL